MTESGGPTAQAGIIYQNSITALFLGRLLDVRPRVDRDRVTYVRTEAPEDVDDTVVKFADGHTIYIQAKLEITSRSAEWVKLWRQFEKQFCEPSFQKTRDRLSLYVQSSRTQHRTLESLCERTTSASNFSEFKSRLTKAQGKLLEKIILVLLPLGRSESYILQLLQHVDIEIVSREMIERDFVPLWMPESNKSPTEMFRLLRDHVANAAAVRGGFSANQLRRSIQIESNYQVAFDVLSLEDARQSAAGNIVDHIYQSVSVFDWGIASSIKNFLTLYLGSARYSEPFGGRRKAFEDLSKWLNSSTPYAAMIAPAGRGKSATLCRWLDTLRLEDYHVIFVPISRRFNLALESVFFATLAIQLVNAYEQRLPIAKINPLQWQGIAARLLNTVPPDKKLLIVIDGLDESVGWNASGALFPLNPPDNIKILVSARLLGGDASGHDWLRKLSWDADPNLACLIQLPRLTLQDLEELMHSSNLPFMPSIDDHTIADELFRLSQGEPLIVNLYMREMSGRKQDSILLNLEQLRMLSPGFRGFFDKWLREAQIGWNKLGSRPLQQENVRNLIGLFAVAKGPLFVDDIVSILEESSSLQVRDTVQNLLSRFVIGDGLEQGYIFSHPRLTNYFLEQWLTSVEIREWQTRFVHYGQQQFSELMEQRRGFNEVSIYLLQFYVVHLQELNGAADEFYKLIKQEWRLAWFAYEGGYSGFLSNVLTIMQIAKENNNIAMVVRCGLCLSSVIALSSNLTPELLALGRQLGVYSDRQLLTLIQQMAEKRQQADALVATMPHIRANSYPRWVEAAISLRNIWQSSELFGGIYAFLDDEAQRWLFEAAIAIPNIAFRAMALGKLAANTSDPEKQISVIKLALDTAFKSNDTYALCEVLKQLLDHLSHDQLLDSLKVLRNSAFEPNYGIQRLNLFCKLSARFAGDQWPAIAEEGFLRGGLTSENEYERRWVYEDLAGHLDEDGKTRLLTFALNIPDEQERTRALCDLAVHLSGGQQETALQAVFEAPNWTLPYDISKLVPHVSEEQRQQIIDCVLGNQKMILWGYQLKALASYLDSDARRQLLQKAATFSEYSRETILTVLAPYLSVVEIDKALALANTIEDEKYRAKALAALAEYVAEPLRKRQIVLDAIKAAEIISDEWQQATTVHLCAKHLTKEVEIHTQTAIAAIKVVPTTSRKARIRELCKLLPQIDRANQHMVVTHCLDVWSQIQDWDDKQESLTDLLPHLNETQYQIVLSAILMFDDEWNQLFAISKIVFHLSAERREMLWEVALAFQDVRARNDLLCILAAYIFGDPRINEVAATALEEVFVIEDKHNRAWTLCQLAEHFSHNPLQAEIVSRALQATLEIEGDEDRVTILGLLSGYCSEEQMQTALRHIQTIEDEGVQANGIDSMLPHLSESLRDVVIEIVLNWNDDKAKLEALATEAIRLPVDVLTQVPGWIEQSKWGVERVLGQYVQGWTKVACTHKAEMLNVLFELVEMFSVKPRPIFLQTIGVLAPMIAELIPVPERATALETITSSIGDVQEWWP